MPSVSCRCLSTDLADRRHRQQDREWLEKNILLRLTNAKRQVQPKCVARSDGSEVYGYCPSLIVAPAFRPAFADLKVGAAPKLGHYLQTIRLSTGSSSFWRSAII